MVNPKKFLFGITTLFSFHQCTADSAALQARWAAAAAEEAATIAAAQAVIEAAAAAEASAIRAAAKKEKEAAASASRLEQSAKDALIWGEYSNKEESPTFHITNKFLLKSVANTNYCMTLPPADTFNGFKNGQAVIVSTCDASDSSQHFSFDPSSSYIHPGSNKMHCLDFDFDAKNNRPVTLFRCDKTFSSSAKSSHQKWEFFNGSNIKNLGTGKCMDVGSVYDGKAVEQEVCSSSNEQLWYWVPDQWYKAQNV